MTKQFLYILDANSMVTSSGIEVPEIPDPVDPEVMIADAQWITDRTADLTNVGVSEQVMTFDSLRSDYGIPKYIFDPVALISANITERDYVTVIKASQVWKDRKKRELQGGVMKDFKGQKENKYQNLKLKKLDAGTMTQPETDHIAAFEAFRATRLAQYQADKTANGIT